VSLVVYAGGKRSLRAYIAVCPRYTAARLVISPSIASGESWKHSAGQKTVLNAFGYYSAKSEPIWMKSGALCAHCWGLALTDFGCDRAIATI